MMDLAQRLIDHVTEGVVVVAHEGRVLFANVVARALLGGIDGLGWWAHHLRAPDGRAVPRGESPLARALRGEVVAEVEMRVQRDDGTERTVLVRAHPLEGYGAAAYFRDVTEQRRKHSSELRRAVTTDQTTKLPNRDGFVRAATELLARGVHVTVLAVDLDDFRRINNEIGHDAGDAVLLAAAQRLQRVVRHGDIVARAYRGDEFLILLAAADETAASHTAARVLTKMRDPVSVDGRAVKLTASIGIAAWHPGESAEDVIVRADRAERLAKADGKDRFRWAP